MDQIGIDVHKVSSQVCVQYATRSRKVKTDRRDARCLAEACRLGAYRAAHRTSDTSRRLRDLVPARKLQVRMRTRTIVTARSILRREGFRLRGGGAASFRTRVEELAMPADIGESSAPLLDRFETLSASIEQADRRTLGELRGRSSALLRSGRSVRRDHERRAAEVDGPAVAEPLPPPNDELARGTALGSGDGPRADRRLPGRRQVAPGGAPRHDDGAALDPASSIEPCHCVPRRALFHRADASRGISEAEVASVAAQHDRIHQRFSALAADLQRGS